MMTVLTDLPPEIQEHILEYVCRKDLKSYRQASKHCRNSTLPIWNKFVYVKISDSNYCGGDSMRSFLRMVNAGEMVGLDQPFTNFILDGKFAGEKLRFLDQFLEKCGAQVKSLNLKDSRIESTQCIKQILFQACTNLTDLTFSGFPLPDENVHLPTFQNFSAPIENRNLSTLTIFLSSGSIIGISFWMDLFKRIPCLKRLLLKNCNSDGAFVDIFTAIGTVLKEDPSQLKLREISFDTIYVDDFPCEVMQILTDPGLNLKRLNIFLHESAQLNNIVQCHASSLNMLKVYVYPWQELDYPRKLNIQKVKRLDILNNLAVLKMKGQMCMAPLILKSAPNLEILSLRCFPDSAAYLFSESWMQRGLADFQLTKCTELEMNNYLSSAQIHILTNVIPNVTKLKMPLDDASFAEICKRWPNLVSLEAPKSKISEAGITGLDERDIQIINRAGENGCVLSATVARANISALKSLQSFVISDSDFEMGRNPPGLRGMSYCSIKYGFQQVPSLQNVRIKFIEVNGDFWATLGDGWSKPKYLIHCSRTDQPNAI